MKKIETGFDGLFVVEPHVFNDERGFFVESYSEKAFAEIGIHHKFVQHNHSRSSKDTIRGLHYQAWPGSQAKLVRCTSGEITDVVVDIRPCSETYLKFFKVNLSSDNFKMLMIPNGFIHGFAVRSEFADVQYLCSSYYEPKLEKGFYYQDPVFGCINWDVKNPILSDRDRNAPMFDKNIV